MPKSSSLGVAVGVDQDVAGLEIAVDHQVPVRVLHRGADLAEQRDALARAESRAPRTRRRWRCPRRTPSPGTAGRRSVAAAVEQAGDVGMLQRGQDLALVPEAAEQMPRCPCRGEPS